MSEWRNKGHVFDLLSDEEINEAKIAKSVVKRGGSLKFMFEIKNNPQKYPNLSKLKNDALRILHDELGNKLPKEELPDPRFIDLPTEEESARQYEKDKQLEFANTNKGAKKMKIKLSKSQWEMVGRKAGWMKTAQIVDPDVADYEEYGKNKVLDMEQFQPKIDKVNNNPKFKQLLQQVYSKYPKGSPINADIVGQLRKMFESAGFRGWEPVVAKVPEQGNEPQEWFID